MGWVPFVAACSGVPPADHNYPQTRRDDVREMLNGTETLDPYRWLEDQESYQTLTWIDLQNTPTRLWIHQQGRDSIRRRLAALMKVDSIAVPNERGGRYIYSKRRADQHLAVIYMKKNLHAPEESLVGNCRSESLISS